MRRLTSLFFAATLGVASAADTRPNILFIVSDDLNACLGAYGNEVCQTPHLDRLAAEGITFQKAYCQYPVCGASRASFMSGLYPARTHVFGNGNTDGGHPQANPDMAHHPALGTFLRDNGYFTARVSKIYHMGVPGGMEAGDIGGDDPANWDWAYNVLAPELFSPGELELYSPGRLHYGSNFAGIRVPNELADTQADAVGTTQAIAILENRAGVVPEQTNKTKQKPADPFFLAVGLVRPHVPLVAPERCFELYDEETIALPEVPEGDLDDIPEPARAMRNEGRYDMDLANQRRSLAAYYASVTYMDEQVGRLLDTLDRLQIRDNTIVVFFSDHGWNLGQHNCWQKMSFWEDTTRVPLIVSAPGFESTAGQDSNGIVELIDLYPTLVDLAGFGDAAPEDLQGESLRPLLEQPDRGDWDKVAYTVMQREGRHQSIRRGPWRYSDWAEAGEELYNHDTDPGEFTNLAQDPQYATALDSMRDLMTQTRAEAYIGEPSADRPEPKGKKGKK